ncbi:hypothetical protein ACGK9U_09145 [Mariniflexile sp. HNIBRBA6329]|uniref:hypothetical protein n=1 Tax=Mariniflexile sp. HNIBRBA6329 TaxID=3373088 RepID=UPI0037476A3D
MVREVLTDYSIQKNSIISSLIIKQGNGLFDQNLHDIFNRGSQSKDKLRIQDVQIIIEAIELKLREAEIIYHTYFGTEYDKNIIIFNRLIGTKLIDTEFNYGTRVIKKTIEIIDSHMYKEVVDMKFQLFILRIATLYENLVKLIEILIKKRVVFGNRNPHLSVHLKVLISYWDNLVELDYRKNDEFYLWLSSHRTYLEQYLSQINSLRNSYIHGYSLNLTVDSTFNEYVINNYDSSSTGGFPVPSGGGMVSELVLNNFVQDVLNNTKLLTESVLNLFQRKLAHHRTKVPM